MYETIGKEKSCLIKCLRYLGLRGVMYDWLCTKTCTFKLPFIPNMSHISWVITSVISFPFLMPVVTFLITNRPNSYQSLIDFSVLMEKYKVKTHCCKTAAIKVLWNWIWCKIQWMQIKTGFAMLWMEPHDMYIFLSAFIHI